MSQINPLVKEFLDSADSNEKKQIREMIVKMGVPPGDPLFNLYAELGNTQEILTSLPTTIQSIVTGWTQIVDDKLEAASYVAVQQQKTAVARAVEELIKSQDSPKKSKAKSDLSLSTAVSNLKLAQIGVILGFVFALGTGIGIFTYATTMGTIGNFSKSESISASDKELLKWAKSSQGKLSRRIMQQNAPIIETCKQSKKAKGCIIVVD
ncbi:MAG: hypothetical protein KME64_42140 [Scytonematopsis contorta HA4267-MV1]|jgi:outer membrane phospholipase A|nr:hypothetical protein [Scytonematopsis contorta HA4267-MV1]